MNLASQFRTLFLNMHLYICYHHINNLLKCSIQTKLHQWFNDQWQIVGSNPTWSKEYKLGIQCISDKLTSLNSKNKDQLAWNQDVYKWSNMSTRGLRFTELVLYYKNPTSVLVQYKLDIIIIIISSKVTLFSP